MFPEERKNPFIEEGSTFKINVLAYGKTLEHVESKRIIESCFEHVKFRGKVMMDRSKKGVRPAKGDRAANQFWWIEDLGCAHTKCVAASTAISAAAATGPRSIFFGREVAMGQRHLLDTYDLKKRRYLCTTSMTAENSFLVANFAHARPGALVLDPFCGSCSLLIAAAHFGAETVGGDIDIRVLRGKERDAAMPAHCRFARKLVDVAMSPLDNFRQYGLREPLDLLRCDISRPVWRTAEVFDAIVCDPPYGVRAGARKTGTNKESKPIPEELRANHIPGTVPYGIADVMIDLLNFAARFLRVSGRLVYWMPTAGDFNEDHLPAHPCLRLAHQCEEQVTMKWKRRLITMVKTRNPTAEDCASCRITDLGLEAAHDNFPAKYWLKDNKADMDEPNSAPAAEDDVSAVAGVSARQRRRRKREGQAEDGEPPTKPGGAVLGVKAATSDQNAGGGSGGGCSGGVGDVLTGSPMVSE